MKKISVYLIILFMVTLLAATIHLLKADRVEESALVVRHGNIQVILHADDLPMIRIQGEIVDGKGETKPVDGMGMPLADLLAQANVTGASSVTATAQDSYSAVIPAEDFARACVVRQADGGFRLIVFQDADSKRSVRDLIALDAE